MGLQLWEDALRIFGRTRLAASQNMVAGIILVAISALALWLTQDLTQGTLSAMGAGLLPRWLAVAVGISGIALLITALRPGGETVDGVNWRGVALILIAIIGFAIMIKPFSMGPVTIPALGFLVAGPFAVVVGGMASPEARLRELLVLAFALTAFCMLLFSDLLNLPIPIFPQVFASHMAGASAKLVLRAAAAILFVAAIALALPDIFERRRRRDGSASRKTMQ